MEDKLSDLISSVNMALQMAHQQPKEEKTQPPSKRVRYNELDSPTSALKDLIMEQMNNMQNEYKKQIADLKHELSKKSNDGNDKKGGGDKDRGKGKGNKKKKPYIEKNRKRWAIDKYCWTHGACNHNSHECE